MVRLPDRPESGNDAGTDAAIARRAYLARIARTPMDDSWIDVNPGSSSTRKRHSPTALTPDDTVDLGESLSLTGTAYLDDLQSLYDDDDALASAASDDEDGPVWPLSQDIDLATSLSTLISSPIKQTHRPVSTPHDSHVSSRVSVNSLRIVSDAEMKMSVGVGPASPAASFPSGSRKSKRRSQSRRKHSDTAIPVDMSTISLAAAGISLVAGISFSAGYALGRRSAALAAAG